MPAATHTLTLPGPMLERGFWLYVWMIDSPIGELLYVGRTGDNSSPHASPPFTRMGQHLSKNPNQNALRRHLESRGITPEECASFSLVAHGPLFPEARDMEEHRGPRDVVAALEKALAETLSSVGYSVLNIVNDKHVLDQRLWAQVRDALTAHFPRLGREP